MAVAPLIRPRVRFRPMPKHRPLSPQRLGLAPAPAGSW